MIIRFIDEMGFHDHVSLLNRDIKNNPDLIEWTIDELYAQGCNDFEVCNPTWEETIREFLEMQKELHKAQERHEEHKKIEAQRHWRALRNGT